MVCAAEVCYSVGLVLLANTARVSGTCMFGILHRTCWRRFPNLVFLVIGTICSRMPMSCARDFCIRERAAECCARMEAHHVVTKTHFVH